MARPPGRVAGKRREVAGTNRGTARGRAGRTANAPTGAAGPSTRAGLMSAGLTPTTEPHRWVHVPVPRLHSRLGEAFPARDVALGGGPRRGGHGCPARVGAERGGAGACPGLGLRSRAAAEGGEGAGKEGAPAVLQCSAAPSPPARPRSAARHCGNADGSPARAGPNRSGHPLPARAAPCPRRAGLPLSPASSAPFRFPPAPAGTAGRFLPRRDAAGLCPRHRPLALCLGARRDPHPEYRRTPPAATLGAPSSTPASLCVPPRRRDLRSPRCCTHSGQVPALLRSSFSRENLPYPYLSSGPSRVSVSLFPSPCPRCPLCAVQQQTALRGPRRGGGPTSSPLPRQTLGTAAPRPLVGAPGEGEPRVAAASPRPCVVMCGQRPGEKGLFTL